MARVHYFSIGLTLSLLVPGCAGDDSADSSIFADDEGIDGEGSSSSSSGDTFDSEGTAAKLDMPIADTDATAEGGESLGCAAIDFLFVIDNSGSMGDTRTRSTWPTTSNSRARHAPAG